MSNNYAQEKWKTVKLKFDFKVDTKVEVSNYGRVRTFNKVSKGKILSSVIINGYPILRLKFYKPRTGNAIDKLKIQVEKQQKKIKKLKESGSSKSVINAENKNLASIKQQLKQASAADLQSRIVPYNALIHRLVATSFVTQPSKKHQVVAHKDFNKSNNKATNLVWMTPEQNYAHQQKSPLVKAERVARINKLYSTASYKLNAKKVAEIKKQLNKKTSVSALSLKYGVSETQIIRIKKGENWSNVKAAK